MCSKNLSLSKLGIFFLLSIFWGLIHTHRPSFRYVEEEDLELIYNTCHPCFILIHNYKDSRTEELHHQFHKSIPILEKSHGIKIKIVSFHGLLSPASRLLLQVNSENAIKFVDRVLKLNLEYEGKKTPQIISAWVQQKMKHKFSEQKPLRNLEHFVEIMKNRFQSSFKHSRREDGFNILYLPTMNARCNKYGDTYELVRQTYERQSVARDKDYFFTRCGRLEMLLKALMITREEEADVRDVVDEEINKKGVFSDWFSLKFWLENLTSVFKSVQSLQEKYCLEAQNDHCMLYADSLYNLKLDIDSEKNKIEVGIKGKEDMQEVKFKESIRKDKHLSRENRIRVEIMEYLFNSDPHFSSKAMDLVKKRIFKHIFTGSKISEKECNPTIFHVMNIKKELPNRFFVVGEVLDLESDELAKNIVKFMAFQRKRYLTFGSSIYNNHFHEIIRRTNLILLTYDSGDLDHRNRIYQIFSDMIQNYERKFKLILLDRRDFISYFIRKKLRMDYNEDLMFQRLNNTYSYVQNFNFLDFEYFFRDKSEVGKKSVQGTRPEDGNDFYWEQVISEKEEEERLFRYNPELGGINIDFENNVDSKEIYWENNEDKVTISKNMEKGETKIQMKKTINLKEIGRNQNIITQTIQLDGSIDTKNEIQISHRLGEEQINLNSTDWINSAEKINPDNHGQNKFVKNTLTRQEKDEKNIEEKYTKEQEWAKRYSVTNDTIQAFINHIYQSRIKRRFLNEAIPLEEQWNQNIRKVNTVELERLITSFKGETILVLHTEFPSSILSRIEEVLNKEAHKMKNTQILK